MKQCLPQNLQKEFLKLKARSLCTSLGTRQPHTEMVTSCASLGSNSPWLWMLWHPSHKLRLVAAKKQLWDVQQSRPRMSVVIDKTEQQGLAAAYCRHYSCTSSSWFTQSPAIQGWNPDGLWGHMGSNWDLLGWPLPHGLASYLGSDRRTDWISLQGHHNY